MFFETLAKASVARVAPGACAGVLANFLQRLQAKTRDRLNHHFLGDLKAAAKELPLAVIAVVRSTHPIHWQTHKEARVVGKTVSTDCY